MSEQFAFDVFLSHSSKDKPVVRELVARLKQDGVRVWLDEEQIKPGDSIPAKVEEGLEHSRVLVLCMSANAFGSDWAQLETGTFRFRDPLNKERRFIPLRLDNASIKGSLAQFLYISWLPANREQQYAKLLEAIRDPATWSQEKTRVFLAEGTDVVDKRRRDIKEFLGKQLNCDVLTPDLYPQRRTDYEDALRGNLPGCKLFVQLLGENPGRDFADDQFRRSLLQYACAKDAGVRILQWLDPSVTSQRLDDLEKEDKEYARFLQGLEVLGGESFSCFLDAIKKAVTMPDPLPTPGPTPLPPAFVFVNREPADDLFGRKIEQILTQEGHFVFPPIRDASPGESLEDLTLKLANCEALVLVDGSTRNWVIEQIRQARKLRPQFLEELRATSLVLAPPPRPSGPPFAAAKLLVVDCRDLNLEAGDAPPFLRDQLRDLIRRLKTA